eukprot:TRINITY_DN7256_c0_g1_i1.p1 TRINITY_DN7256_c0_g1~~TRINITY_DN7256_c0_g1_i1.p1  ORF type:complete len:404 (-),score=54.36 TRINITY_DN7256_c0_g1_i1:183-1361(-)
MGRDRKVKQNKRWVWIGAGAIGVLFMVYIIIGSLGNDNVNLTEDDATIQTINEELSGRNKPRLQTFPEDEEKPRPVEDYRLPQLIFFTTLGPIPKEGNPKRDLTYTMLACWNWLSVSVRKEARLKFIIFSENDNTRNEIKTKFPNLIATDQFSPNIKPFNVPIKSLYSYIFRTYPDSDVTIYFNGDILFSREMIQGVIFSWSDHHEKFINDNRQRTDTSTQRYNRGFCATAHRRQVDTLAFIKHISSQFPSKPWEWSGTQTEKVLQSIRNYQIHHLYSGYDFFACSHNIWDWDKYFPDFYVPLMCADNMWIDDCRLNGELYRLEEVGNVWHMSGRDREGDENNPVLGRNCDIYAAWGKKNEAGFPRQNGIVNWVVRDEVGRMKIRKGPYGRD